MAKKPSTFIENANLLSRRGNGASAMDVIFEAVASLVDAELIPEVDRQLGECDVGRSETRVLIALLTSTLCIKRMLPGRSVFLEKVRDELRKRGRDDVDALMKGLD